ncbi:serine/threonine-protein kinase [Streptomyces sp. TRM68416]|uniref:serine/threonine-protein kinase n=1 Tax=Streptomyces sp. TRM68416 TaxID=2758412 RepID=UPI001661F2B8|nr:serine/threonine-protein kinase [Streptomyces sp. TRM68416]MBD0842918.1 serine/threonine protein kinase [Streptomyces sp. TRM68416]
MTMVKAHVSTPESVAGRYRLVQVVHRETNRVCWYGEDVRVQRPCLVTQIGLPDEPPGDGARRVTDRVVRTSERMGLALPDRVAEVVDAVEESGDLWIVTEWIEGTPLGEVLAGHGTLNYARAARIGLELLEVLEAAHAQGITHGELSPGQVYVRDRGPVVVTGFGLAGATLAPRLSAPAYASPEQARDERIGPAADLWALGALLYTMLEGRPPFRDRGRPEATLKGVDRLPLRTPVRSGPLTRAVQGLLRKDSRERLTRPVVRETLLRALDEEPEPVPEPRLRGRCLASPGWSRRAMVGGTALAVITVAGAALAVTGGLPDGSDPSASGTKPRPAPSATPSPQSPSGTLTPSGTPAPSGSPSGQPSATPSPSPSPSRTALPAGFARYDAPEGFSVTVPEGWRPLRTDRVSDLAYRVTLGAEGDPRTLAVTYSERVGPDPVTVWRDVEPSLKRAGDYRRIGKIRATTHRGREAAEMEWLTGTGDNRVRTFGRGFLIGDNRGYSLRWTAPAADWDDASNRRALGLALNSFREPSSG